MPMNARLLRPRSRGVSTALPLTIAGLEWWIDAADSASVTLDSGRVSQINDKSGKGRHAANSTSGSTQPDYILAGKNGYNLVRFAAASSQRLTVASSKTAFKFLHDGTLCYVALVVSQNTVSGRWLGTGGDTTTKTGIAVGTENAGVRLYAFVGRGTTPGAISSNNVSYNILTNNTISVIEMLIDAGNATASERFAARNNGGLLVKANAATGTPSTADATHDMQIGAQGNSAQFLTGDVCEILMYSQQPTAAAQTSLRQYLGTKWGITVA